MSGSAYYEKSDTVLWALTPEGVLLHNFANQKYVELKGTEHLVWAYLDGAHNLDDVCARIATISGKRNETPGDLRRLIQDTFERLLVGSFVMERLS